MLHHTADDVDLAVQRSAQRKHHAALHLLRHGVGVDHGAAVDRTHHAVHTDLTLLQRNLRHLRHDGAKGFVQRDALRTAHGHGLAPARLVGRQLQHRRVARRVFEPLQSKRQRVLLRGRGQFVDEALREKRVVRMAHRTPVAHGHAGLGGHVAHVLVQKAVGQVEQALGRGFVGRVDGARNLRCRPRQPAGGDGVARRLDAQAADFALCVNRRLELGQVHGAVKVVPHVFFARPQQLNRRTVAGHGHLHGLADKVHFQSAAKATAEQRHVHGDIVFLDARHFGGHGARQGRHLRGHPNLDLAVDDLRGAVHGLQGGVGQVGRLVQRVDARDRGALGQGGFALFVKGEATVGVERLQQLGLDAFRVGRCGLGGRPLNLDGLCALARMPGGAGHHGQATGAATPSVQGHDPAHTGHGQCSLSVHDGGCATEHRVHAHGGEEQPRQAHVHGKNRRTVDFGRDVGAWCALANQLPIGTGFGLHLFGRLSGRGCGHQAKVRAAARGVLHQALAHSDLAGGHLPSSGGGLHQTGASGGRGHAQRVPQIGHAR